MMVNPGLGFVANAATDARPIVCVQGLGFVGAAMAIAVASARDRNGSPVFDVIGVDLPNSEGETKVTAINEGRFPFRSTDEKLVAAITEAHRVGNLSATTNPEAYALASVVIVDVNCDACFEGARPTITLDGLREAVRTVARRVKPGTLIVVETTVPPGTCENVIAPELSECLASRGLARDSVKLTHSYERVMPGRAYLDSIANFWRVYAGLTSEAADACEAFLSKVINVSAYPLRRLSSLRASETAKILENSYRAVNIAFIEEWGRFAEAAGIDLFEVIEAVRVRPTHSNMRQPGFGVGGYCLPKDPLFAEIGAKEILGLGQIQFPFSDRAVAVNHAMPLVSLEKVRTMLKGTLEEKTILLLGVSYRPDVADTRYSPSEVFVRQARLLGARVLCHDPLVDVWPEMAMTLDSELPPAEGLDAIVLAVPHTEYSSLDFITWLGGNRPLILDANNVLSTTQREVLRKAGCAVESIGRGAGL